MVVKRKMAEQSAEHFTRLTTNHCLKTIARRQLDGQHLLCGVFADLNSPLSSKHVLSR